MSASFVFGFDSDGFVLLNAVVAAGPGAAYPLGRNAAFQATVTGTGHVTASIAIKVSNDGVNWATLSTIALNGQNTDSQVTVSAAPFVQVRADVNSISGTGAAVTCLMSRQMG